MSSTCVEAEDRGFGIIRVPARRDCLSTGAIPSRRHLWNDRLCKRERQRTSLVRIISYAGETIPSVAVGACGGGTST